MAIAVCTLFEGHYHHGVAVLVNSLAAAGYEGTVWVGHRGPLPDWLTGRAGFERGRARLQVTPRLALQTVALDPPVSLNYHKPAFMRALLHRHAPEADAVVYLDPDLVVKCAWPEIEAWLADGEVALIEDVDGALPSDHPKRQQWHRFFATHGEQPQRPLERYYNSGFVGVPRALAHVLGDWQRICERVAAATGSALRQRKLGAPDHPFHSTDEDALNFALSLSLAPLHTQGPEAMDFAPGGRHLSHAVGTAKPWQGRHFRGALRGRPPSVASQAFYRFARGPLRPFSAMTLARRRVSMALASALGRLYRRG
ncbi:hypothetical protein [Variovorax sp. ZT4R33]|uniref:hypothetical protein n=1 Tax=Variovorax sp. ZT4R33 TaxID=3443743 RepID=UPI003F446735